MRLTLDKTEEKILKEKENAQEKTERKKWKEIIVWDEEAKRCLGRERDRNFRKEGQGAWTIEERWIKEVVNGAMIMNIRRWTKRREHRSEGRKDIRIFSGSQGSIRQYKQRNFMKNPKRKRIGRRDDKKVGEDLRENGNNGQIESRNIKSVSDKERRKTGMRSTSV